MVDTALNRLFRLMGIMRSVKERCPAASALQHAAR